MLKKVEEQSLEEIRAHLEDMDDVDLEKAYKRMIQLQNDAVRNPFYHFTPLPTQKKFIDDPAKNKWLFGGNQSGKSTTGVWFVINDCTKNKNHHWWCGAETWEISRIVQQSKFNEMLPVDDVDYASYNPQTGFRHNMIKFKSGSTVSFRSYDQEQKRWQGWTGHGILLDEEPPWDIYQECTARVAKNNGFIIGTMTSMSGYSRLVEEVVFSGKVRCYFIETYENSTENGGALTPDALKRLESEIEEKDRDARLRGIPTPKTGLVFEGVRLEAPFLVPYEKEWEPKKNLPTVVSLDPHPKIPHAAVWIQIDTGGGLWVVKERPWLAEEGSKALSPWVTPAILAHEIGQFNRGLTIENVLIDKFACHTTNIETGSNFQAVLANLGLFTLDAGGDVQNKIVIMQQLIRQKKIHIFESCWNLLWEIKRYVWEDHISRKTAERREVKQKPRKKDDHLIDCLMNAILYIHTTGLNRTNFPTGTLVRNPTGAESLDKKDMFNNPGQSDPILMEYYQ